MSERIHSPIFGCQYLLFIGKRLKEAINTTKAIRKTWRQKVTGLLAASLTIKTKLIFQVCEQGKVLYLSAKALCTLISLPSEKVVQSVWYLHSHNSQVWLLLLSMICFQESPWPMCYRVSVLAKKQYSQKADVCIWKTIFNLKAIRSEQKYGISDSWKALDDSNHIS